MENKLKVLVTDVETTPILAYVWGLKDQNISLNQIKEDWSLMAWGAKWLDSKDVMYMDCRDDKDDKRILKAIWKLLDEADIVVTQNGKKFDSMKLNARFMLHGLPPPSPYKHHDTYLIARDAAAFTSHKLEYLTDKLNHKYKKINHASFPGFSLWTECLKGNKKAWDAMKEYNIYDVLSTEELYKTIRQWAPKSAAPVYNSVGVCEICGSKHIERRGFEYLKSGKFQKIHCKGCGRWSRGGKVK